MGWDVSVGLLLSHCRVALSDVRQDCRLVSLSQPRNYTHQQHLTHGICHHLPSFAFFMVEITLTSRLADDMEEQSTEEPRFPVCVGCGGRIHDQYILRVWPDLEWHATCLRCAECRQRLDETSTCFFRDGKTYCKRDYARLFGTKCASCALALDGSDLVLKARGRIYHPHCFRCSGCARLLVPGDEFCLRDGELLCTAACREPPISPPSNPTPGEPVKVRQVAHRSSGHKASEKTTRIRTVLNEKQLHTLRTCYNANPRPDALMKEQLVEMTGLSPRVIRVWFQNKRCKDKKKSLLVKQLQQQQYSDKPSLQGLTGTPLVVGSPVRHGNNGQANPVEVQTYQPSWKTEFALQRELDRPPFQHLVSFSESGSSANSSATSLSSQFPDTPNSMAPSPVEM